MFKIPVDTIRETTRASQMLSVFHRKCPIFRLASLRMTATCTTVPADFQIGLQPCLKATSPSTLRRKNTTSKQSIVSITTYVAMALHTQLTPKDDCRHAHVDAFGFANRVSLATSCVLRQTRRRKPGKHLPTAMVALSNQQTT